MSNGTYAFVTDGHIVIGNDSLEGVIGQANGGGLLALTNKLTGTALRFRESQGCTLRLASDTPWINIPEWRFCPGSGEAVPPQADLGYQAGFHLPGTAIDGWTAVQQLHHLPIGLPGYSAVTYPGYGWYRCQFELPAAVQGQPIQLHLGGHDHNDWLAYWVYLNGAPVGHATPAGRWHAAPTYLLHPDDAAYAALHFGAGNVLAVQARGLDRRTPEMVESDAERFSIGSLLVDQYLCAGEPYREVSAFEVLECKIAGGDEALVELRMANRAEGLEVDICYTLAAGQPHLHEQVSVRNVAETEQTLLEVDVQRLAAGRPVSAGGLGFPCTIGDEFFCGICHPAGLARGDHDTLLLQVLPGRRLAPAQTYEGKVAVFGVALAGQAAQSFVHYLAARSPRRRELLTLYDIYGLHDNSGRGEPTELTDELMRGNLDVLAKLQERGIHFDYYFLDSGWSNPWGDLRDFDPRHFPNGAGHLIEKVRAMDMKLGLWVSPTSGPMAFHPEVENDTLAGCGTLPGAAEEQAGHHRGTLCMVAEPWRTLFREALLYHVREYHAEAFKLDGNAFWCTNPAHDHLPGKYSVEPIMDALIDTMAAVRQACPDVFYMYYWNIRSPWWLLYGHTLYERGILMEGATGSDFPTRLLRQSITVSFDQAAHFSWNLAPLASHDSLGVWISDTRWGNWMKKEGWQDAWVMELARGSLLCQLWGDVSLFDDGDVDFLAWISAWARDHERLLQHPRRILGDPWQAEPYGYACFDAGQGVLFLYNPQFRSQRVTLQAGPDWGLSGAGEPTYYRLTRLYPRPQDGVASGDHLMAAGDTFDVQLQPFEVQMLAVAQVPWEALPPFPGEAYPNQVSLRLPCVVRERSSTLLDWGDPAAQASLRRAVNGRAQYIDTEEAFRQAGCQSDERDRQVSHRRLAARLDLPPLRRELTLLVVVRLSRDGIWWHHHALFDVVRLTATTGGAALPVATLPNRWHEQAGGWSWIQFRLPAAASESPAGVDLAIEAFLPASVDLQCEAWLFKD